MSFSIISWLDGDEGCTDNSFLGYWGLIIWVFLSIYIFVGLHVLCEHYFVPSLTVLGEKMGLSEDVCGATLMAAGSSSPELFTALIGVFLYPDENPGPSTNCASAAFNMCVIVGLSILCSSQSSASLRCFPLARDCIFYGISALSLYIFYEVLTPGAIEFGESLFLVMIWIFYVFVLYFDVPVRYCLHRTCAPCACCTGCECECLPVAREVGRHHGTRAALGASDSIIELTAQLEDSQQNLVPRLQHETQRVEMKVKSRAEIELDLERSQRLGSQRNRTKRGGRGRSERNDRNDRTSTKLKKSLAGGSTDTSSKIRDYALDADGSESDAEDANDANNAESGSDEDGSESASNTEEPDAREDQNERNEAIARDARETREIRETRETRETRERLREMRDEAIKQDVEESEDSAGGRSESEILTENTLKINKAAGSMFDDDAGAASGLGVLAGLTGLGRDDSRGEHDLERQDRFLMDEEDEHHLHGADGVQRRGCVQRGRQMMRILGRYVKISVKPFEFLFARTSPRITGEADESNCKLTASFVISIVWLAFLTFLVVDLSNKIGLCLSLTPDVMGLTLLAVGSSLPDTFSSVLVAKQGKMGMAVSNALGSNVFDICVCVGLSFLLNTAFITQKSIKVETNVEFQSFILGLFVLLALFVVLLIMDKLVIKRKHGFILLVAYAVFIVVFSIVLDNEPSQD